MVEKPGIYVKTVDLITEKVKVVDDGLFPEDETQLLKDLAQMFADPEKKLLKEQLASIIHNQWCHWMNHMFSKCDWNKVEGVVIPDAEVKRWERLMETPYLELTGVEKQSDKKLTEPYMKLFKKKQEAVNLDKITDGNVEIPKYDHVTEGYVQTVKLDKPQDVVKPSLKNQMFQTREEKIAKLYKIRKVKYISYVWVGPKPKTPKPLNQCSMDELDEVIEYSLKFGWREGEVVSFHDDILPAPATAAMGTRKRFHLIEVIATRRGLDPKYNFYVWINNEVKNLYSCSDAELRVLYNEVIHTGKIAMFSKLHPVWCGGLIDPENGKKRRNPMTKKHKIERLEILKNHRNIRQVQIGTEFKLISECSDSELDFLLAEAERARWQGTNPKPNTKIDVDKFLLVEEEMDDLLDKTAPVVQGALPEDLVLEKEQEEIPKIDISFKGE